MPWSIRIMHMSLFEKLERIITPQSNLLLLLLVSSFVFITPFFPPDMAHFIGQVLFSLIFFISIFALDKVKRTMWLFAVLAFITEWTANWVNLPVFYYVSTIVNIAFFQVIVIMLIIQIAKSPKSDASVIFEAINGYLMMGLMFTSWVAIAMQYDPNSFSFYPGETKIIDYAYFTFVTMTTLGYGDVTPQLPYARSLSILISTAGQIYVAVIIAMLVGKYAGAAGSKQE